MLLFVSVVPKYMVLARFDQCFYKFNPAMAKCFLMAMLVGWIFKPVHGQVAASAEWVTQPEVWYDSLIGIENSGLINGRKHQLQAMGRETHPFFGDKEPFPGTLLFRGQLYHNVPLLYDIYQDVLIFYYPGQNQVPVMIELEAPDVDYFLISNHKFERLKDQQWMNEAVGRGYVEVLYDGEGLSLLAKRKKLDFASKTHREFASETWYFVRYRNRLSQVSSQRHLGTLFPSFRSEISKYAKQNHLKIRSDQEEAMVRLVQFCDSLVIEEE